MVDLHKKDCVPCKGGVPPLNLAEIKKLLSELGDDWQVLDNHLEKEFSFSNFQKALDFTNRIGEIAEQQNHHPDIFLTWGKVKIILWTHKIDGLTESDFILAAKISNL